MTADTIREIVAALQTLDGESRSEFLWCLVVALTPSVIWNAGVVWVMSRAVWLGSVYLREFMRERRMAIREGSQG